jgi:hypothetical protein
MLFDISQCTMKVASSERDGVEFLTDQAGIVGREKIWGGIGVRECNTTSSFRRHFAFW